MMPIPVASTATTTKVGISARLPSPAYSSRAVSAVEPAPICAVLVRFFVIASRARYSCSLIVCVLSNLHASLPGPYPRRDWPPDHQARPDLAPRGRPGAVRSWPVLRDRDPTAAAVAAGGKCPPGRAGRRTGHRGTVAGAADRSAPG